VIDHVRVTGGNVAHSWSPCRTGRNSTTQTHGWRW
jgi:hypothetical protein